jgi:4-hydroxythreonine-4-phosphate dehydrogenase
VVAVADPQLLLSVRAHWALRLETSCRRIPCPTPPRTLARAGRCRWRVPSIPGRLEVANAPYVRRDAAGRRRRLRAGRFDALVTARCRRASSTMPACRSPATPSILAARCRRAARGDAAGPGGLRVALATTHLPLRDVSAAHHGARSNETLRIMRPRPAPALGHPRPADRWSAA